MSFVAVRRAIPLALAVWFVSAGPAFAQWYRTYDEALEAMKREDWAQAISKLEQAKEQARRTGTRPGRRVLRYSMVREPFLPDLFLAQAYVALATRESNDSAKRAYYQKAIAASVLAEQSQVRQSDPEFQQLQAAASSARDFLATDSTSLTASAAPHPGETAAPVEADEIKQGVTRLLERADAALANADWQSALESLQEASRRLNTASAATAAMLRANSTQVSQLLSEVAFARDVSDALQALSAGRFDTAANALERLQRTAGTLTMSSAAVRTLAASLPARLAEARAAQALTAADATFRARRWSAAIRAYEDAERLVAGVEFTSPQARALADQLTARRRESGINAALDERRFADVLAIDPSHRAAAEGQYAKAIEAFSAGRWEDAAADFGVLLKYVHTYRDAADRKAAADLQVEYGLGILAEQGGNSTAARQHYQRVLELRPVIRGPLLESAAIVRSVEGASDRLRTIDAQRGLETARRQYENGQWDEAINSVNLVLRLLPDNPGATELLGRLNDRATGEQVQRLIRSSKEALARNELEAASTAATQLQALLPANEDARYVLSEVTRLRGVRRRQYQWAAGAAAVTAIGPLLLISPRRRGRFFAAIGRPTAALRLYEKVLASHPTDGVTLSRAAELAAKNAINAPLHRYFDAYLRSRPDDSVLAAYAADYFWTTGDTERAAVIYGRLLNTSGAIVPASAIARLNEFYVGALPTDLLLTLERRYGSGEASPAVIALLAREYDLHGRTDGVALEVYRAACTHDPRNARLRVRLAQALLAAGDSLGAIDAAGTAACLCADAESLELLAAAHARAHEHDPGRITSHLERLNLSTESLLVTTERVLTIRPDFRQSFSAVYRDCASRAVTAATERVLRAHSLMDGGALQDAATLLQEGAIPDAQSPLELRMYRDVNLRYLSLFDAAYGSTDYAAVARLAQIYMAGGWWEDAIRTWQRIVSVPEWNRRSMTAISTIVDQLSLEQIVHVYFATSDWQIHPVPTGPTSTASFSVTPGDSLAAALRNQFARTRVFCHSALVTVDQVVGLKRQILAEGTVAEQAIAFLVSPQAVRHDVYALIYAFMTEEPAVTVIPLEAQHLRDAIIEARTHGHLERTLHQWLGHTDIYETHNPVSNAATFFGRGHFINQLVLKISRGENFGIFGLRKIGKTSLVYRLRELSRDHLVAYVDLQGVSSRRTVEVYRRLADSLARDMRVKYPELAVPVLTVLEAGEDIQSSVAGRFHADVLSIRRAMEAAVSHPPNMLLLLDEIELMVPYGSSQGFDGHQEFFRHIRGMFQQERFIVSAIVGATPLVCRTPTWEGRDNPVFQFYDEVFLAMLDRVECDQMVQGLGELMGVRFDRASLDLIYEQTAGHPYVTRQLCSRLVRLYPERPLEVRSDMVAAATQEYLAQRGDYFSGIIEGYLRDDARRVVECIAMADAGTENRSRILQRFDSAQSRQTVDRVLGDLELVGVVTRTHDNYALRAPLFRRWLRRSWLGIE